MGSRPTPPSYSSRRLAKSEQICQRATESLSLLFMLREISILVRKFWCITAPTSIATTRSASRRRSASTRSRRASTRRSSCMATRLLMAGARADRARAGAGRGALRHGRARAAVSAEAAGRGAPRRRRYTGARVPRCRLKPRGAEPRGGGGTAVAQRMNMDMDSLGQRKPRGAKPCAGGCSMQERNHLTYVGLHR